MKHGIFVAFVYLAIDLSIFSAAWAQSVPKRGDSQLSPLISVSALAEKIEAGDEICLIEIGDKRERYEQGHIKGAHFLHWVDDIIDPRHSDRYNIPDQASIEALLSKLGVTKDSHIVVYDRFANRLSTRMYWTLNFFGHDTVQVLDGGFPSWSNSQVITGVLPMVERTNYKVTTVQQDLRANVQRVEKVVQSSSGTLIDGRPVKQYTGEEPGAVFHTSKSHQNKGHIPGAVNIPWKNHLKKDGTFKSVAELKEMYRAGGIDSDGPIITYCNEGLHAALPWFVASALLKCKNVSLYDDSMAEWANSDRPVLMAIPED
jgi:thiosulfate/3-mercaptopyruvate sulfurtransferase